MGDVTVYTTVYTIVSQREKEDSGPRFFYLPLYDFSEKSRRRTKKAMEKQGYGMLVHREPVTFREGEEERIKEFTKQVNAHVFRRADTEDLNIDKLEKIINEFRR